MIPLLLCAAALAQDERDEDAIFGGSSPPAEPAPDSPASPDTTGTPDGTTPPVAAPTGDAVLDGGSSAPTDAGILARLAAVDERLAIGGRLYLRADTYVYEDTPAGETPLASPNLLDLYADVRPNDRLRAYARGRVSHDFTVADGDVDWLGQEQKPTTVTLDQLFFNFDVGRTVFVTAGRQRIKWGTGRFWNPTDFLNQQVLDPLAAYDERTGVALLKAHVPIEAAGVNLYALANLEGADTLDQVGGALRAEWLVGNTEISASAAARKDQPIRLGADVSTALWVFDLRVEGAVQHGVTTPFYQGTLDLDTFTFPTDYSREDDWIPQVTAGLEVPIRYSDEDSLTLGVEGFYNDAGYDDATLYPWLILNGGFQPFYLGKEYAGAYVYVPSPGRWNDQSFTGSWLANLSDGSMVGRLDWRATVLTRLSLNAYLSGHFGEAGGEFRFALDVPPVKGVDGLEDGITVPAPVLDAGVGLQLTF